MHICFLMSPCLGGLKSLSMLLTGVSELVECSPSGINRVNTVQIQHCEEKKERKKKKSQQFDERRLLSLNTFDSRQV